MLKYNKSGISIESNSTLIPEVQVDVLLALIISKHITDEKEIKDIIQTYNFICEQHKISYGLE